MYLWIKISSLLHYVVDTKNAQVGGADKSIFVARDFMSRRGGGLSDTQGAALHANQHRPHWRSVQIFQI